MTLQGTGRLLLILALGLAGTSCNHLDLDKTAAFQAGHTFGLGNTSVVRIDPAGRKVAMVWQGFNVGTSGVFGSEWERIYLHAGTEHHLISSEGCEPGQLKVDTRLYRFDHKRQMLLLQIGTGVSIVQAEPPRYAPLVPTLEGPYRHALKIHDNLQGLP